MDLQHLRRFAKVGDVPNVVREAFERARVSVSVDEQTAGLRESSSSKRSPGDGSEGQRMFSSSGDASRRGAGADETEGGKLMVGGTNVSSSKFTSTQESTTATSDYSLAKNPSPTAQAHETITSDVPEKESSTSTQINPTVILDDAAPSSSSRIDSKTRTDDVASKELFMIVGSTNATSFASVAEELSDVASNAVVFSVQVPRLAPTSQEQAALWSSQYWPTVYKKSNPFGPHPSIVSRTEQGVRNEVEKWMDLASEVARQADMTGSGEPVGVVIVERRNGVGRPVAVAGDARWIDWPCKGPGNVTAHAALRAIAMVAAGLKGIDESEQSTSTVSALTRNPRLEIVPTRQSICIRSNSTLQIGTEKVAAEQVTKAGVESSPLDSQEVIWNTKPDTGVAFMYAGGEKQISAGNIFQDKAILAGERDCNDQSGTETGYLCHDLEIYCTHEPCVMCSMAILHSRFGKTIFQHRMPKTGGMCSDGDLGHGLFWRKELNWTLLAWQWIPSTDDRQAEIADLHA